MKVRFLFFLLFLFSLNVQARSINISLFNDFSVNALVVSVVEGSYKLTDENKRNALIGANENFYLSLVGEKVFVNLKGETWQTKSGLRFNAQQEKSMLQIRPLHPVMDARRYRGNLLISADFNRLLMINQVDFGTYLAGVVEAEGGPSAFPEYYKAQALLCRTYAKANESRHIEEGFNLCDGTHCQAYKGAATENRLIQRAVEATREMVLVDENQNLITAAYHSNSGGFTEDAMNVWLTDLPYLKSFHDPYSLHGRNIKWEKSIDRGEWISYLNNNGLITASPPEDYSQVSEKRSVNYEIGNLRIPLIKIRNDWNLRSAFFSVFDDGSEIIFKGKGYGHGIGLSQEGAMEMAKAGMDYRTIIDFYFTDVYIISVDRLTR